MAFYLKFIAFIGTILNKGDKFVPQSKRELFTEAKK